MKLRPLVLGAALGAAILVAGCNNQNETGNPDEMNNTGAGDTTTDGANSGNAAVTPAEPNAADSNTTNIDTQAIGDQVDDGVITTKVKSALLADDTVKGLDINVDTAQGVVSLKGKVDSQAQIDAAMQIAKSVEGVKDVQNELTVQN